MGVQFWIIFLADDNGKSKLVNFTTKKFGVLTTEVKLYSTALSSCQLIVNKRMWTAEVLEWLVLQRDVY